MNDENEMILDSAQDADVESPEETAQGGEQSAGADVEVAAEQDSADGQEGSEDENSGSEDASEDEEFDDYDEFYHDMSDFDEADINGNFDEDDEDFEGGDTTTDPEGEDGDEGENEGEESENADDEDADEGEQTAEGEQDTTSDEGAEAGADDNAGADDQPEASESAGDSGTIDYASWEAQDRAAILKAHPELEGLLKGKHLSEVLDDPGLFGYMRGTAEARAKYSAVEAFEKASAKLLATRAAKAQAKQNSKQHINSSSGKAANAGQSMPPEQRRIFRDMFPDLTPAQREELYKSVT